MFLAAICPALEFATAMCRYTNPSKQSCHMSHVNWSIKQGIYFRGYKRPPLAVLGRYTYPTVVNQTTVRLRFFLGHCRALIKVIPDSLEEGVLDRFPPDQSQLPGVGANQVE
ncbi:hypothetical protein F4814DRAFT_403050 [Daldinia grandis]|nr:hypothetical protein F4814DRAFT_403050 [Daldinia grandis]